MSAESAAPVPAQLGRFRVSRRLGQGAMGEVFAGEDPALARPLAIKLLSAELAKVPEFRERFHREAVAMAQVSHPNVLSVYELGEHEGRPFFAMELLDGGDVLGALEAGPVPVGQAARWIRDAALGLAAAAEKGLVHRDVKPANLMLHRGRVKVCDFGIARILAPDAALTQFGTVMGTPDYMAPEQAMGIPVDARADIYALGMTAFHMLTGQVAFTGRNYLEVLQKHMHAPCPDPRTLRPELPAPVCELVLRMVQKKPEDRPQKYEEIAAALAVLTGDEGHALGSREGPPAALRFVGGPLGGKRVALPLGESFVGRQVDCLIVLEGGQVSRRHAALVRTASALHVRDLGSRNGVLVNGVRVPHAELVIGDQVRIGDVSLLVEAAKADAAPEFEVTAPGFAIPLATMAGAGRLALLAELTRELATGAPFEVGQLGELTRVPLIPLRRVALIRLVEGAAQNVFHATRGSGDSLPPLAPAMALAVSTARTVHVPDARRDPRFAGTAQVATVLAAPLLSPDGVLGVLYADAQEVQALSDEEHATFEIVANLVAALLARG